MLVTFARILFSRYIGNQYLTCVILLINLLTLSSLFSGKGQLPANICEDPTAVLLQSLRAVQIDDSIERISGSPVASRETKHYASSGDFNRCAVVDIYSSPSKSASIGNFNMPSADSSPNAERHKQIMESPSWRRGDGFVRQVHGQVDDPFVSPGPGHASTPGKYFYLHSLITSC